MKVKLSSVVLFFLCIAIIASTITFLMKIIFPGIIGKFFVLSKDASLVFLFATVVFYIIVKMRIDYVFFSVDTLIVIYLSICVYKYINSGIAPASSLQYFWALFIGPTLFLVLKQVKISPFRIQRILTFFLIWLISMHIIAVLIYFYGQEKFLIQIGMGEFLDDMGPEAFTTMYRLKHSVWVPRMSGLLVSPLVLGFSIIIAISLVFAIVKSRFVQLILGIVLVISFILCDVRSVLMGIVAGVVVLLISKFNKIYIYMFFCLLIIGIVFGINLILSNLKILSLDSSTLTHIDDLFIRGPELVLKNWAGVGVGMTNGEYGLRAVSRGIPLPENFIGNIECFYYSLSIQIGIVGLFLYLLICYKLISEFSSFRKSHSQYKLYCDASIFILISIHVAGIFLPVLDSRLLSVMMWSIIGMMMSLLKQKTAVYPCLYKENKYRILDQSL